MQTKTPTREEALAHFGVKGMKWGVRKPREVGGRTDRILYGKKGVARIKEEMATGLTARQARRTQQGRLVVRALLTVWAGLVIKNAVKTAAYTKLTQRGREAIPAIMATAGKLKYAPLKGGAYVITTLK